MNLYKCSSDFQNGKKKKRRENENKKRENAIMKFIQQWPSLLPLTLSVSSLNQNDENASTSLNIDTMQPIESDKEDKEPPDVIPEIPDNDHPNSDDNSSATTLANQEIKNSEPICARQ
ncbi:hypothetical protein FQA39_LY09477 [Lamprigera yunnana]|nr:hypothetical protein FQA39_LY09477 [Lamprigera yunnana]